MKCCPMKSLSSKSFSSSLSSLKLYFWIVSISFVLVVVVVVDDDDDDDDGDDNFTENTPFLIDSWLANNNLGDGAL